MTEQTVWFIVADLTVKGENGEPYAVIKVEPTIRSGTGCQGTIVSLYHDRRAAEIDAHTMDRLERFVTQGTS